MPSNDNENKQQNKQPPIPIDQETIKAWITNQTLGLQNQKAENEIRIKEIEANTRLSEKSLEIQKSVLENQGGDFRMTVTRLAYIAGGFLILLLLFVGFCLWTKNEAFAYKFCQGISYLITTIISFIIGRKSVPNQKNDKSPVQDDEQVF